MIAMEYYTVLFAFLFATSTSAAIQLRSSNSSSSLPWPEVPCPEPFVTPTGPVHVYPTSISSGVTTQSTNTTQASSLKFDAVGDVYTLDYGRDVAGKPFFNISSLEGYAQIEVKYSEAFVGLQQANGDGPYAFANGLANTFRVETFNITSSGLLTSYFIQGSQRWQSIKLIAGSNLEISTAGFVSSVDETPLSSLQGYFASSNSTYTDIWALGPRTQQLVCFPPGSQTSTWEITDKGAYVRGQKPATTARVVSLSNYTLSFETMIDFGGTGWRVDTEVDAIQATGPIFVLTSEYPEGSFANIDRELVPPNTLVLGRGWSLQNQTSLPGFVLDKFPLNFNVSEKTWHTIQTISHGDDLYTVLLNGQEIAHFNISSYGLGDPNPHIPGGVYKSFALGPWQDQAAFFRNVNVTLNGNGENVYSNDMLSKDVLVEYGVQTNDMYLCSDSGKRDRYSWLGDRLVSSRTVMVGTGQEQFVWGPAEEAFSRQIPSGQVPINTLMSPLDTEGTLIRTTNVDPLIVDYQFDFMQLIYNYWLRSGNDTFFRDHWSQMVAVTSYAISRSLDETTQLYGGPDPNGLPLSGEKGQALGPANTVALILGLERMADMAEYLGYNLFASTYRQQASLSRTAIETLLWNATGNFYASTIGADGYDIMDIAQVLIGEIGSSERRQTYIQKLAALKVPAGYINGTRFFDTPGIVDPYYTSFLLEGLAKSGETQLAQGLLDDCWSPMVRRDRNYTGGYWEYVSTDGTYPGLDLFTGQSHFWGSYPTTFLTEYALGIRPVTPGYAEFVFAPLKGFKTTGSMDGLVYAAWGYGEAGKMSMEIEVPTGLKGTIVPPFDGTYSVGNGSMTGNVTVMGGQKMVLTQD